MMKISDKSYRGGWGKGEVVRTGGRSVVLPAEQTSIAPS